MVVLGALGTAVKTAVLAGAGAMWPSTASLQQVPGLAGFNAQQLAYLQAAAAAMAAQAPASASAASAAPTHQAPQQRYNQGGYHQQQQSAQDEVAIAVNVALAPAANVEPNFNRMVQKFVEYVRKAAEGLDTEVHTQMWTDLVDKYADNLFKTLFPIIGDRSWMNEVDFLLMLDAAVKSFIPKKLLADVPPDEFENAVLRAHDRAFEEQRFSLFWETFKLVINGQKTRTKLFALMESSRRDAACGVDVGTGGSRAENFVRRWIDSTVMRITMDQGSPEGLVSQEDLVSLFQALIDAGALPLALVAEQIPPPQGWAHVVANTVQESFAKHNEVINAPKPRELCKFFANGWCAFGATCFNAHIRGAMPQDPISTAIESVVLAVAAQDGGDAQKLRMKMSQYVRKVGCHLWRRKTAYDNT